MTLCLYLGAILITRSWKLCHAICSVESSVILEH